MVVPLGRAPLRAGNRGARRLPRGAARHAAHVEAECGHHYGRAMASWSAVLALTGFHYSGIQKEITFNNINGTYFWSNGYAYGTVQLADFEKGKQIKLDVLNGNLELSNIVIENLGELPIPGGITLEAGETTTYLILDVLNK